MYVFQTKTADMKVIFLTLFHFLSSFFQSETKKTYFFWEHYLLQYKKLRVDSTHCIHHGETFRLIGSPFCAVGRCLGTLAKYIFKCHSDNKKKNPFSCHILGARSVLCLCANDVDFRNKLYLSFSDRTYF